MFSNTIKPKQPHQKRQSRQYRRPRGLVQDELQASVKFSVAPLETECRGTLSNRERITRTAPRRVPLAPYPLHAALSVCVCNIDDLHLLRAARRGRVLFGQLSTPPTERCILGPKGSQGDGERSRSSDARMLSTVDRKR